MGSAFLFCPPFFSLFSNSRAPVFLLLVNLFFLFQKSYCDWQLLYYFLCPLMQEFLDMIIDTDQNE
jgi:hypothetical protein